MQQHWRPSRAIIAGASGGIGMALVDALKLQETRVTALSRHTTPPIFLEEEASIETAAISLDKGDPFDLVVCATGALVIDGRHPERRLQELDPAILARAFAVNAIGPAMLIKYFSPLLPRHGRCVFACLSARVGSIGDNRLGGWYSYRASKAALNQIVRTAAIELGRSRPDAVVLALHPNTVRTALSAPFTKTGQGISPAQSAAMLLETIGRASESGAFLDYAGCSIPW